MCCFILRKLHNTTSRRIKADVSSSRISKHFSRLDKQRSRLCFPCSIELKSLVQKVSTIFAQKSLILFRVNRGQVECQDSLMPMYCFFCAIWSSPGTSLTELQHLSVIPWFKKIIWVVGVLRWTLVCDCCFDNLSLWNSGPGS